MLDIDTSRDMFHYRDNFATWSASCNTTKAKALLQPDISTTLPHAGFPQKHADMMTEFLYRYTDFQTRSDWFVLDINSVGAPVLRAAALLQHKALRITASEKDSMWVLKKLMIDMATTKKSELQLNQELLCYYNALPEEDRYIYEGDSSGEEGSAGVDSGGDSGEEGSGGKEGSGGEEGSDEVDSGGDSGEEGSGGKEGSGGEEGSVGVDSSKEGNDSDLLVKTRAIKSRGRIAELTSDDEHENSNTTTLNAQGEQSCFFLLKMHCKPICSSSRWSEKQHYVRCAR